MAPDLNSLPPSRAMTSTPLQPRNVSTPVTPPVLSTQSSSSPRSRSTSLAAAATMNATDRSRRSSATHQTRGSPRLERVPSSSDRMRSQIAGALNANDPSLPSPGEMPAYEHRTSMSRASPGATSSSWGGQGSTTTGNSHHQRQPSLGEIHNEMEQEQEAQVNRILQMIRAQQHQLDSLQRPHQESSDGGDIDGQPNTTTAIVDEPTPMSERSFSLTRRPVSLSRTSSSAHRSPALRALPSQEGLSNSAEWSPVDSVRRNSVRDESAYYQAETANLTRENQMLKHRIRELEKQLSELSMRQANSPLVSSNLNTGPSAERTTDSGSAGRSATDEAGSTRH